MSLKRSRKQMSKVSTTSANNSSHNHKKMANQKTVRFNDDATTSIPPSCPLEEATEALWYTRVELHRQLEDSKAGLGSPDLSMYSLLVDDSYSNPHMKVQEYLNAYCAGTDSMALRGLECTLSSQLNESKIAARREHSASLLRAQQQGDRDQNLYAASRKSSASAKLFAMRMGRADARWEEEQPGMALELVQEHEEKEEGKRRSSLSRASSSSIASEDTPTAAEPPCTTVIVSPCSSPLAKQLQQVALPRCSSPLRQVMALPEIVFGKFTAHSTATA